MVTLTTVSDSISESRASFLCDPIRNRLTDFQRDYLFPSLCPDFHSFSSLICFLWYCKAMLHFGYLQTAYVCSYVYQIHGGFTWVD